MVETKDMNINVTRHIDTYLNGNLDIDISINCDKVLKKDINAKLVEVLSANIAISTSRGSGRNKGIEVDINVDIDEKPNIDVFINMEIESGQDIRTSIDTGLYVRNHIEIYRNKEGDIFVVGYR